MYASAAAAAAAFVNEAPPPATRPRQHERAPIAWRARLVLSRTVYLDARAVDLSEGGVGVLCADALGDVRDLELWLAVPSEDNPMRRTALRLRARVVFQVYASGGCRIGLQFMNLDPASRALVRRWVQRCKV